MVKRKALFLFIMALALGVGAAMLANRWIQRRLAPQAEVDIKTTPVVVAALEITFGKKIEAAQVKTVNWPNQSLPEGIFSDVSEVEGRVAKQKILPGEVLLQGRVAEHIDGSTLSAVITPKFRAVTVRVNDVIGVAGFLLPGNRVDVLSTHKVNRRAYTKTILEDLKVLAVDQTASPDKDKPLVVRAVTLEMTPKQAERLVKATQVGNVQLSLRNPVDDSKIAQAPKRVVKSRRSHSSSITIIRGTSVDVSKVRL
jgi:pilus assembly protein CpaB